MAVIVLTRAVVYHKQIVSIKSLLHFIMELDVLK